MIALASSLGISTCDCGHCGNVIQLHLLDRRDRSFAIAELSQDEAIAFAEAIRIAVSANRRATQARDLRCEGTA